MLAVPYSNSWGFQYTNHTNGVSNGSMGTSVVPGASNVEGAFTSIASGANIAAEVQYVVLNIGGGLVAGQAKNQLLDFGWDPTGGTSYTAFFSDLVCGAADNFQQGPAKSIHFPCKIPAGSQVAVRLQGSNGTAGTVRILAYFYGKPSRPELWRPAAYSETVGAITNSNGVSFTPGNASFGTWTSLGATTKKNFWAQLGVQIDNATQAAEGVHLQLGVGDGTNMDIITDTHMWSTTSEGSGYRLQSSCQWEIPSGATLYVRGNCSGAPASGYNATAVCFGG